MSLLIPLGLLGLLGLLVLLIIYLIKPNYQQKLVSSTFIWKLSLKYKKKRLPVSRLRNLLLLLCQILVIVLFAFILTQPAVIEDSILKDNEKVAVIDAAGSMLATAQHDYADSSRFERAVDGVIELAEKTFRENGTITIILAGETAEELFTRVSADAADDVFAKLEELKYDKDDRGNPAYCTYGSSDIEGAMALAESVTIINPLAEVLLYTGKHYLNTNGVTVVDMSLGAEEVNVAILDVRAVLEEGYYTFYADIVSYGENSQVTLRWTIDVDVHSADGNNYLDPVTETTKKSLIANEVTTVVFDTNSPNRSDGSERPVSDYVFEYKSATAIIIVDDAIAEDNSLTLYGGSKQTLNVQYASTRPSIFFSAALMSAANSLRNRWDVHIDEVRGTNGIPAYSGYDLYIFEYALPRTLPTDGVVMLIDTPYLPSELDVLIGESVRDGQYQLYAPETHPLIDRVNVGNIMVSNYRKIISTPEGYETIMQCSGVPVFISKNTPDQKIAIMSFSLNYSDMAVTFEFPTLVYNIFEYFIPSTFTQYIFDVNESITLNCRGATLKLEGNGVSKDLNEFPTEYKLTNVGIYTTTQTVFNQKKPITENFFVKMPADESNIFLEIDILPGSVVKPIPSITFDDLLVYFAAALVALLFIEWLLQAATRI